MYSSALNHEIVLETNTAILRHKIGRQGCRSGV